eukprot:GHVS01074095.1.p1 GENE.GHVS01074095.1~~GHVS01074095.1.p1  ORF type:complete len:272 (-),score=25.03 GHVS01074095.1:6-821(-)
MDVMHTITTRADKAPLRVPPFHQSCLLRLVVRACRIGTSCACLLGSRRDVLYERVLFVLYLVLQEVGCIEVVGEMMVSRPLNSSIIRSGTELFAKIGEDSQISSLMQQILAAANNPAADDRAAKVDRHCVVLAVFLTAPITNPVTAVDRTWECLRALSKCLEEMPEKGLWANVALVSQRLCYRSFGDPTDHYGVEPLNRRASSSCLSKCLPTGIIPWAVLVALSFAVIARLQRPPPATPTLDERSEIWPSPAISSLEPASCSPHTRTTPTP